MKNAKFIVVSLVILLAIPTALGFAIAFLNPISLGPGIFWGPEISIDSVSYDSEKNAVFLNCTLIKGYKGATECNLTEITIENYKGRVFEGIPVPTKLLLNETTIISLNLGSPLPPEIYYVNLKAYYGGTSCTLNIGNFVDPQEQIEVKEIFYDKATNTLFVECNRIYDRTDLFVVIKDNQSAKVNLNNNFDRPARIDLPPDETQLRISPQEPLVPGQYCLYIVTTMGLITQFTVP